MTVRAKRLKILRIVIIPITVDMVYVELAPMLGNKAAPRALRSFSETMVRFTASTDSADESIYPLPTDSLKGNPSHTDCAVARL